jgi:hypothetical protein
MMAAYGGWAVWFGYLFWKLFRHPRVKPSICDSVGVIGWGLTEMPSRSSFTTKWLKRFDYQ